MKNLFIVIAFVLSFSFIGASVYIIITQPENKDAWGWLMALGFLLSAQTIGAINKD